MSIPFFFKAFQFSNGLPDKHIYVDGGMVYNYPLSFFDHKRFCQNEINTETLGLYLYAKSNKPAKDLGNNTPMYFAKQLLESAMDAQDIMFLEDRELLDRSVMIDDLNYAATDFNLSRDDMNKLMASGTESAKKYMESHK